MEQVEHSTRRFRVGPNISLIVGSISRLDNGLPCSGLRMSPNGVRDSAFCNSRGVYVSLNIPPLAR